MIRFTFNWGSWHFRHDTHTHTFLCHTSRALTWSPPHTIHRALYADRITVLNLYCIPFHPITLHHLKTDNLTILPASYETLSARWEMTDLKSCRRATLQEGLTGPGCILSLFPCHCIAGREKPLIQSTKDRISTFRVILDPRIVNHNEQ